MEHLCVSISRESVSGCYVSVNSSFLCTTNPYSMSLHMCWCIDYCMRRSYRDRTGKMRSFWEANRPLIPVLVFLCICATWAYHSPSDIISRDPRAFYLMSGTIFSNLCVSATSRMRLTSGVDILDTQRDC